MTERERLIGLILDADIQPQGESWSGTIADYLLEHGAIVPPCKVGDTVWCVIEDIQEDGGWFISEEHVTDVTARGIWLSAFAPPEDDHGDFITWGECGANTFFTREEAEAALAERRRTQ